MKTYISIFIGLWYGMTFMYAQNQVTGKIIDNNNGLPIPDVLILNNQHRQIGISDAEGNFTIASRVGDTIILVHDQYITQYEKISSSETIIRLQPKPVELHTVIITTEPVKESVHSQIIKDKSKTGSQLRNAADLFKDIPGFYIQKRSNTSMEPSLRSFKYEQMNIRYNGSSKLVNACPNRMDPVTAHIMPEEVKKIEIIKGPYSVRFGQTFGPVVNMVTRQPEDYGPGMHGVMETGFEINGNNKMTRGEWVYVREKYAVGIEGEYRDFGDYIDGEGIVTPAGFKTVSYSMKTTYSPNEKRKVYAHWYQKFGRDIKHAGLPMDSPKDDSYLLSLQYVEHALGEKWPSLTIKAYTSYVDHLMTNGYEMDEPRPNYPAMDARTPVWARTSGGKAELEWKPRKNWSVFWGTDMEIIQRDGEKTVVVNINPNTGQPLNPPMIKKFSVWQNAQINDFGFYSEAHFQARKHLFASFGARLDAVYSFARNPDPGLEQIYGQIEPQTQLAWSGFSALKHKKNGMKWEIALGAGTRTPSMTERYIYRFTIGEDAREYIGNPFLKPETNFQLETGWKKTGKNFSLTWDVFASYFHNYITAVITPSLGSGSGGCGGGPAMAPRQFKNVEAFQYGFDVALAYKFYDNWKIFADFSYLKARNLSLDEPLAQVMPPFGHLGVKYTHQNFWVEGRTEWVSRQDDFSPSFGESPTPGHVKFDLRSGWKPSTHWSLGMAVLNITDEAYYNHMSFYFRNQPQYNGRRIYEPGRSFNFYIKYQF